MTLPSHVPERPTITLSDFSWYVRTRPAEPFEDLDADSAQAVERGARGTVVCSTAAPQHPTWADVALQQECNATFTGTRR